MREGGDQNAQYISPDKRPHKRKQICLGLEQLGVLVASPRVVSLREWPAICREIIDVFISIQAAYQPNLESGHSLAFLQLARFEVQS